jgi:hypothetical protein
MLSKKIGEFLRILIGWQISHVDQFFFSPSGKNGLRIRSFCKKKSPWLAEFHTQRVTLTKVANFGNAGVGCKNRGLPGASVNALSTTSAFWRDDGNQAGLRIFRDRFHRACLDARSRGAMAAYGNLKEAFFLFLFLNPD